MSVKGGGANTHTRTHGNSIPFPSRRAHDWRTGPYDICTNQGLSDCNACAFEDLVTTIDVTEGIKHRPTLSVMKFSRVVPFPS